jgi:hypothetical protein
MKTMMLIPTLAVALVTGSIAALGLVTEANATSKAQLCERQRSSCLTRHPADVCQSYVDFCISHKPHVGGLTGTTAANHLCIPGTCPFEPTGRWRRLRGSGW